METVQTPEVDFFINDFDSVESFPFLLTWEEAKNLLRSPYLRLNGYP